MMRCLRDMNMSKFVAEDVPLFLSLIDDLFPGLKADRASFPEISAALEKVGQALHLLSDHCRGYALLKHATLSAWCTASTHRQHHGTHLAAYSFAQTSAGMHCRSHLSVASSSTPAG